MSVKCKDAAAVSSYSYRQWMKQPLGNLNPRIPLEICERVIDSIPDRKSDTDILLREYDRILRDTLLACALTCRAWLPRSRLHLHHSVALHDKDELGRFMDVLRASPKIGPYVQLLHVSQHGGDADLDESEAPPDTYSHLIPLNLAQPLSKLQTLAFEEVNWANLHPSFLAMVTKFTTVKILDLSLAKPIFARDLLRILGSFPSLTDLSVKAECPVGRSCKINKRHKRTIVLTFLYFIVVGAGNDLLTYFHETSSMRLLNILMFDWNQSISLETLNDALEECVNLVQFTLVMHDPVEGTLSLSGLSKLQRLYYTAHFLNTHIPFFNQLITSTRSGGLSEVILHLWSVEDNLSARELVEQVDWKPTDDALSHTRFKGLERVNIRVDLRDTSSDCSSLIRTNLPLLEKRGVLSTRFRGEQTV